MQDFKPWHAVLIGVAVLAVGYGLFSLLAGGVPRIDHVYLIDVSTGEVFRAELSGTRAVTVPAKHPETGERTLVPMRRAEDGSWQINPRYVGPSIRERGAIDGIDLTTGTITIDVSVREAERYRSPAAPS